MRFLIEDDFIYQQRVQMYVFINIQYCYVDKKEANKELEEQNYQEILQ